MLDKEMADRGINSVQHLGVEGSTYKAQDIVHTL